jgi:hypothetical protein
MVRWQYWKRVGIQIERLRSWQHISYRNIGENTPLATTVSVHDDHSHSMDDNRASPTTMPSSNNMPVRPQRPRANTTPNDFIKELQIQRQQQPQQPSQPSHTSSVNSERHAPTEWRWRWLTDLLCNAQRAPSSEQLYARSQTVEPTIRRESASSVLANILPMTSPPS